MSDKPSDDSPSISLHRTEPPEARANEKRELVSRLLEHGKVLVRVEARRPGVQVPPQFMGVYGLPLNLSWGFPDTAMVVNDSGIAATLRFGGKPFRCVLPWASIWGITLVSSGAFQVWKPDVPAEIDAEIDAALNDVEELQARPKRPKLSVVHSAPPPAPSASVPETAPTPEPEAPAPVEDPDAPPKPRAPWLRLVR